jgi:hypothetical protein
MMERSEVLADWTEHNLQEIQEICPHVSACASDQSTRCLDISGLPIIAADSSVQCTVWQSCIFLLVPHREFVSLVMTSILGVLWFCRHWDAKPHVCWLFKVLMSTLTLADCLCCGWFIYPVLCWCWCPEIGITSIGLAQLSRFWP